MGFAGRAVGGYASSETARMPAETPNRSRPTRASGRPFSRLCMPERIRRATQTNQLFLRREDRMIRIRLPLNPAEHIAFAYSPLLECVLSLHVLVGPKHHALHHAW